MRFAGDIADFLADNALTRSWRDSIGNAINFGERRLGSDEELRNHLSGVVSRMTVDGKISDEQIALLSRLKGEAVDRAVLESLAAAHPAGISNYIGEAVAGYAKQPAVTADVLRQELAGLQSPQQQRGEVAHAMATLLGHPVAAYSAVTAGGAMGTAAALEAYDYFVAQQQQAEKNSKLPLKKKEEELPPAVAAGG